MGMKVVIWVWMGMNFCNNISGHSLGLGLEYCHSERGGYLDKNDDENDEMNHERMYG